MKRQKTVDPELDQYCLQLLEGIDSSFHPQTQNINSSSLQCQFDYYSQDQQISLQIGEQVSEESFQIEKEQQSSDDERENINDHNCISTDINIQISDEPCNCSKTRCQKMYCECLARGKMCSMLCNCRKCRNHQPNEMLIKSIKAIKMGEHNSGNANRKRFRSSRYKDGCTCRKSHCNKKYCECYANGRKCSDGCMCDDCHNMDGDSKCSVQLQQSTIKLNLVRTDQKVSKFELTNSDKENIQIQQKVNFSFRFILGGMAENTINCRILNSSMRIYRDQK